MKDLVSQLPASFLLSCVGEGNCIERTVGFAFMESESFAGKIGFQYFFFQTWNFALNCVILKLQLSVRCHSSINLTGVNLKLKGSISPTKRQNEEIKIQIMYF